MTTPPPSDGLGDGTQIVPFAITIDPATLSQKQAVEYRRELLHAYYNPGTEYDMYGAQSENDEAAYLAQIARLDTYLQTFAEQAF